MNCFLYARVSTERQASRQLSIPAQLHAMRQFAAAHGWSIASEFVENGASARTTKRPVLQQMLARCRGSNNVKVVVVHKLDRLARNVCDHVTIASMLKSRGIALVSVTENLDDSVSGRLVEHIMAAIAEFYSANLSEEVRKGMRQKVSNGGWPHKPPLGYRVVHLRNGRSTVDIDPVTGPAMRTAFELYAAGESSARDISKRLASLGVVGSTGNIISPHHVGRLLTNRFYIGVVMWRELEFTGTHRALITPELFDRVQDARRSRHRNPGPPGHVTGFPLRGFAACSGCGGSMTAQRHGRFRHYRCCRRMYRPGSCDVRYTRAERAHADLEYLCRALPFRPFDKLTRSVWDTYLTLDDTGQSDLIRRTFSKIVLAPSGIVDFELRDVLENSRLAA